MTGKLCCRWEGGLELVRVAVAEPIRSERGAYLYSSCDRWKDA